MNQDRQTPPGGESTQLPTLPEATVARLPEYLRALHSLADIGRDTVSSEDLAAAAGINAAKLRKDLSQLGSYGTRGVGYDVELLTSQISTVLGLAEHRAVALVGIGNLGHALAGYAGFGPRGFRIAALFDVDDSRLGETINGLLVRHVDDIAEVVATEGISIAMLTTPPHAAQPVADLLVNAGVTSILNFAPCVLSVPDGVDVRKVDLAIELQILSFHEHRKASARTGSSQYAPVKPVPAKKTAKKTATAKIDKSAKTQSPPKNVVPPPPGVTFSDSVVNE
ncbi:redox-sensing transcriptional repressor [Phytomonospora endophytica]|uniref:Redox-sensing transcriptional repressor Rex n=1 Tax=Phytomonospora endophytica TaxID=714109 RepID=A0A841FS67_9ACTN|nr:redox-sensing transcriptional repressor [Phytomonospora endophytica]GIG67822.1 redox-sensing transcriptional repressor Rex [Phytomonospora endophytica]